MLPRHAITALRKEARAELKKHPADFEGLLSNAAEFAYFPLSWITELNLTAKKPLA